MCATVCLLSSVGVVQEERWWAKTAWWLGEVVLLGKVKGVANRQSWTAVGSVTPQLCSTDLPVTQVYSPISLLFLLLINPSSLFFLLLGPYLTVFGFVLADQVCLITNPYHRLVPVGASQAMALPPAWRHVPGPGFSSPPLLSLACPDLSLIWWGERGICCLLWQRLA